MPESEYKHLQIKLPASLHEAFYKAFPDRGQRRVLIERFIINAIIYRDWQDCFIWKVLHGEEEVEEDAGEEDE